MNLKKCIIPLLTLHIDLLNSSTSKIKRGEKWKTTCGITCTGKGTSDVNALCRLQTDTATIAKIRG